MRPHAHPLTRAEATGDVLDPHRFDGLRAAHEDGLRDAGIAAVLAAARFTADYAVTTTTFSPAGPVEVTGRALTAVRLAVTRMAFDGTPEAARPALAAEALVQRRPHANAVWMPLPHTVLAQFAPLALGF